jgi:hypothetical protein
MATPSQTLIQEAEHQVESTEAMARCARQKAKDAKEKAKQAKAEFKKARKIAKLAKKAAKKAEREAALAQQAYERVSNDVKAVKSARKGPAKKAGQPETKKRHTPRTLAVPRLPEAKPEVPANPGPAAQPADSQQPNA